MSETVVAEETKTGTTTVDTTVVDSAASSAASSGATTSTDIDTAVTTPAGGAVTPDTKETKETVVALAVPEKYDLKLPEGSTVDVAIVERTAAIARELGLSNEAGQKLLDQTVKDETARTEAQESAHQALVDSWKNGGSEFVKRDKQWRAEALADPAIGGGSPEKFAVSIEKAQQALAKFGPDLKTYLDETGLGSHPAAIKFLANIGKAMSEPAFVSGTSGTVARKKTDAEILYPGMYNDDGTAKTT